MVCSKNTNLTNQNIPYTRTLTVFIFSKHSLESKTPIMLKSVRQSQEIKNRIYQEGSNTEANGYGGQSSADRASPSRLSSGPEGRASVTSPVKRSSTHLMLTFSKNTFQVALSSFPFTDFCGTGVKACPDSRTDGRSSRQCPEFRGIKRFANTL